MTNPDSKDQLISKVLADQYNDCMADIAAAVPELARQSIKLWRAVVTVYHHKLWRVQFDTQEEWIAYLHDQFELPRSTVFTKCSQAEHLINVLGVQQLAAADAVALVPGAVARIPNAQVMAGLAQDRTPTQYIRELASLTPGEAIHRVADDAGNTVSLWIKQTAVVDGKLLGVLVRSDAHGYTSFDFQVTISTPDGQTGQAELGWLERQLKKGK